MQPKNQPPTNLGSPMSCIWQLDCCTNDRLSSTRGLMANADLGGILRGEENLVAPTTPVGLSSPDFIAVIGEELPWIPGRDVRDHGTACSLLINKQKIPFWTKSGFEPGTLDLLGHNYTKMLFHGHGDSVVHFTARTTLTCYVIYKCSIAHGTKQLQRHCWSKLDNSQ